MGMDVSGLKNSFLSLITLTAKCRMNLHCLPTPVEGPLSTSFAILQGVVTLVLFNILSILSFPIILHIAKFGAKSIENQ